MENLKYKVMFVCLGNICRSPAAECVFRAMAKEKGEEKKILSASSGLGAYHLGSGADYRMIHAGRKRGYPIDTIAKLFEPERDLGHFQRILAMDQGIYESIMRKTKDPEVQKTIFPFTDFCEQFQDLKGVPDPYYGGAQGFERALDIIEDGCKGLLRQISLAIR